RRARDHRPRRRCGTRGAIRRARADQGEPRGRGRRARRRAARSRERCASGGRGERGGGGGAGEGAARGEACGDDRRRRDVAIENGRSAWPDGGRGSRSSWDVTQTFRPAAEDRKMRIAGNISFVATFSLSISLTMPAQATHPRERDLVLPIGGTAGRLDAITDVAGVEGGFTT